MRIVTIICIVLLGELIGTIPVLATPVRLHQNISPLDCTVTEINTGSGITADSDCAPQRPVIENIDMNGGRPIIRGLFDAASTLSLRVFLAGKWYTLGADRELTATGNVWTLDLSGLKTPLSPGTYKIVVQVRSVDGSLYTVTGQGTVKQSPMLTPPQKGTVYAGAPPDNHGHGVFLVVGIVVATAAAAIAGFLIVARRRRTE